MHKIIILAAPADGHVNPLVPIMSKLVLKGHNVVCITGRNYKNRVENTSSGNNRIKRKATSVFAALSTIYLEFRVSAHFDNRYTNKEQTGVSCISALFC